MLNRRQAFGQFVSGLGGISLAWLLQKDDLHAKPIEAKVKRVVQIFCPGGVSHLDTFDYKPELIKQNGKAMIGKGKPDTFFGQPGNLMKSPFAFQQHGNCGHGSATFFRIWQAASMT